MECVGCAACVDACDEIMTKVGRPEGLVRYDSLNGLEGKPKHFGRPRLFFYGGIVTLWLLGTTLAFSQSTAFEANVLRLEGAPFMVVDAQGAELPAGASRQQDRRQADLHHRAGVRERHRIHHSSEAHRARIAREHLPADSCNPATRPDAPGPRLEAHASPWRAATTPRAAASSGRPSSDRTAEAVASGHRHHDRAALVHELVRDAAKQCACDRAFAGRTAENERRVELARQGDDCVRRMTGHCVALNL